MDGVFKPDAHLRRRAIRISTTWTRRNIKEADFSQALSGRPGFATIFANPVNLKGMAGRSVVMSAAYFLLQLIHFVREKFHRTAAFRANNVVMAAAVVLVLVTGDA